MSFEQAVITLVGAFVSIAIWRITRYLSKKLDAAEQARDKQASTTEALAGCVQAMARMQLVDAHDRYAQQGFMPDAARVTVAALHKGYAGLGANGIVDGYMAELRALPTAPPKK